MPALTSPARRQLIQSALALGIAGALPKAFAIENDSVRDGRLIVVFLRGAYDCCNLLVPTASNFYYESRPDIAIARPPAAGAPAPAAHWPGAGAHRAGRWPAARR